MPMTFFYKQLPFQNSYTKTAVGAMPSWVTESIGYNKFKQRDVSCS